MADDEGDDDAPAESKGGGSGKIIVLVVVGIIVVAGVAVGILFATGAFDDEKKDTKPKGKSKNATDAAKGKDKDGDKKEGDKEGEKKEAGESFVLLQLAHNLELEVLDDIELPSLISGLTIMNDELHIALSQIKYINVYKVERNKKFVAGRSLYVNELKEPSGIVSTNADKSLYITDYSTTNGLKVEPDGSVSVWAIEGVPRGLSATKDNTIIAAVVSKKTSNSELHEYSLNGTRINRIELKDMYYINHIVQLPNGNYLVCHGHDGTKNRVLIVDKDGKVLKSHGNQRGRSNTQLMEPSHLVVDKNNNILVADAGNNRIKILDPSLNYVGDIKLKGYNLRRPYRLCYDKQRSLLYIGEWEGRLLMVKLPG